MLRCWLISAPRAELHDFLDTEAQSLELLQDDASGLCLPMFLISRRTQRSSGREKVCKLTPLLTSRDRRALTVALKHRQSPA